MNKRLVQSPAPVVPHRSHLFLAVILGALLLPGIHFIQVQAAADLDLSL